MTEDSMRRLEVASQDLLIHIENAKYVHSHMPEDFWYLRKYSQQTERGAESFTETQTLSRCWHERQEKEQEQR